MTFNIPFLLVLVVLWFFAGYIFGRSRRQRELDEIYSDYYELAVAQGHIKIFYGPSPSPAFVEMTMDDGKSKLTTKGENQ